MNDRNLKEYGLSAHCLLSQNISLKIIFILVVIKYIRLSTGYLSLSKKSFEYFQKLTGFMNILLLYMASLNIGIFLLCVL